jgi:hypothetical protein
MKFLAAVLILASSAIAAEPDGVTFRAHEGSLEIALGGRKIGEYVWNDEVVRRPYLRHLRTPAGVQVTRNQPPIKGQDLDDHPTFHPGVGPAFGDLSGVNFWGNKGHVRHERFVVKPTAGRIGHFSVRNIYDSGERPICIDECRIEITPGPHSYRIIWDSRFTSDRADFVFGDLEEMGFAVRVASPLAVVRGGEIIDSEGRRNGAEVWGKQADWCMYRGAIDGRDVGVLLMPDPKNFRRSWFHARDYGLLAANPFGRRAFTKGEASRVVVARQDILRLRFGIVVFDSPPEKPFDAATAYRDFLREIAE